MENAMNLTQKVDKTLGRFFLRCCAVVAFLASAAATVFAAVVMFNGHLVGVVILALGAFFLWLGLLAWRDRAALGELLNRDFEPVRKDKPKT
jgi:spore maturation protein SpmA